MPKYIAETYWSGEIVAKRRSEKGRFDWVLRNCHQHIEGKGENEYGPEFFLNSDPDEPIHFVREEE